MDKQKAFDIVYEELMKCEIINGTAKGLDKINEHFIFGLETVMEMISARKTVDDFEVTFNNNRRKRGN